MKIKKILYVQFGLQNVNFTYISALAYHEKDNKMIPKKGKIIPRNTMNKLELSLSLA